MEVCVLDDQLRRIEVIDDFESLIWTERYSETGDFELKIESNRETKRLLRTGTRLALTESDRMMEIEFTDNAYDAEGKKVLTATGLSIEKILKDRVATEALQGLTDQTTDWNIAGTTGSIARYIFKRICVDGALSSSDKIPFIKTGSLYPPGNIPEPTDTYLAGVPIKSVYDAIKELCDGDRLGFRLVRNLDKSELYFDVYSGSDRTTRQTILRPVIFSPDLENMKNTSEVESVADYKNVAYVFGKFGVEIVYADGADASMAGFDRRVLLVDAKDVDVPVGATLSSILQNKGLDALAKQRRSSVFDGEVSQTSDYKYGLHYNLGDLVETRNGDGFVNYMRVTEQIFVSDAEGDRSYPTLIIDSSLMPGTWGSSPAGLTWPAAPGTWSEQ
jgi:hypothetical protein